MSTTSAVQQQASGNFVTVGQRQKRRNKNAEKKRKK